MQTQVIAEKAKVCFARYQSQGALDSWEARLAITAFCGEDPGEDCQEFGSLGSFVDYVTRIPRKSEQLFEGPMTLKQFLDKFDGCGVTRDQLAHIFDFCNHEGLIRSEDIQ